MNRYRLTGNYGTFEIRREVKAIDAEQALELSGICEDLIIGGWEITSDPDGEEWLVEERINGEWVEVDPGE